MKSTFNLNGFQCNISGAEIKCESMSIEADMDAAEVKDNLKFCQDIIALYIGAIKESKSIIKEDTSTK